jgi:uncharacterized protein
LALEKKEELKSFFENLYKDGKMSKYPDLYTLYGSFLSDQKEYVQSEKIFKEGEKYIPNSSNFLFNLAILHMRKEESQKAVDLLKKVITINPNHASSHYFLGVMAFDNGKITEGTMALLSYLVISPTGRYAENAILKLNAKYGQNYLDKNKLVFSESGDNFEEIETILRNQLPLKPAYKVNSKIDDAIIRQVQAIVEYSVEHKMGNGFFETTYIPWIKDVVQKNQFEGLSYYILLGMENKIGKKLTSQKKKIMEFYDNYIGKEFWNVYAKRKLDHFGKQEEVVVFLRNSKPYLVGPVVDNKKEGKYKYLNENGNLAGEVNFKDNELNGYQKYFDEKGNVNEEKTFLNGKLDGTRTDYLSNGAINVVENYKNGVLDGTSTSYYVNGGKQCEVTFINGERNGKLSCSYENGSKKSEVNFKNGKLDGSYILYNEAGHTTLTCTYVDDKINGNYFEYFDGKTIKEEAVYNNGKIQGSYKQYYSNGVIEKEYIYENGKIKKSIGFYASGKKSSETTYNESEETDTFSYFDGNENKYFEEKYKSNELKLGIQYLRNNPNPISVNTSKKPFAIKNYDGKVLSTGEFEKGKKNKEWLYNYQSGVLKIKENYINGKQNGLTHKYDKNGLLDVIMNYKNDSINGVYEVYEHGILDRIFCYQNDKQNGPYKSFYPDGKIKSESFLINNELNSEKTFYNKNGTISEIDNYINDVLSSSTTYNIKSEKQKTIDYKDRTGKFTMKYNNDTTILTYDMVNGEINGKYVSKDKLNNLIQEREYINGKLHNSYKHYSPLGTINRESNYYLGKLNGNDKAYDLVGNLILVDENSFGDEHGKTTRFYHNKSKLYEYHELDGLMNGEYTLYNQKDEHILILGYLNNAIQYYIKKSKTGELNEKVIIIDETVDIISQYPNGKTAITVNFVKGSRQGKFVIYNVDGAKEIESNYENNLLTGERIEYYKNGKIYKKERFKNNNYEGLQEYYKEDGKPWITAAYENDELNGNTLIYNEGKLLTTKKYDSDELVEIIK